MTFFNLTLMGQDNIFKSTKRLEPNSENINSDDIKRQISIKKQLAREVTGNIQSREWSTPATSNLNYHTLRSMHVRGDQDPNQISRQPLTRAQEIGWWTKDTPLAVNEPWTREKRHVHGQSEMTKFVDDMLLTNRGFSLY